MLTHPNTKTGIGIQNSHSSIQFATSSKQQEWIPDQFILKELDLELQFCIQFQLHDPNRPLISYGHASFDHKVCAP